MIDFNKLLNPVRIFWKQNNRTILRLGALALGVSAVVECGRATVKAKDILDDAKYMKFESLGCNTMLDKEDYALSTKEVISKTWKCYIWTTVLLSAAIACDVTANIESEKRIEELTLAYGAAVESYNAYKSSVAKTLKARDIREINHNMVHDIVEKDKAQMPEYTRKQLFAVTDDTTVLFRDIYSSNTGKCYFKKTMEEVRRAEGRFNRMLMDNGSATLNDWYDCLDIGHSDIGDFLGWRWADVGPLFAVGVPDDIDIVEDVAVVTGLGLGRDQYTKFFEMPNKLY